VKVFAQMYIDLRTPKFLSYFDFVESQNLSFKFNITVTYSPEMLS